MQDLKDKIKMEEELEEGATPTPSQENSNDDDTKSDELEKSETPEESAAPEENTPNPEEELPNGELDENSTPLDEVDEDLPSENLEDAKDEQPEKMLTQSQVNELVGKARKEGRESAMKDLMSRYGVYNESELDDIFGRGQAYDDLDYDYKNQGQSYKDAMAENALLKSRIDESRWEDVKLILGGKGLEVNAENISALLPTHQEWLGATMDNQFGQDRQILTEDMAEQMVDNQYQNALNQLGTKKPGVLKKLGNEPEPVDKPKTEEEEAAEIYGYKNW